MSLPRDWKLEHMYILAESLGPGEGFCFCFCSLFFFNGFLGFPCSPGRGSGTQGSEKMDLKRRIELYCRGDKRNINIFFLGHRGNLKQMHFELASERKKKYYLWNLRLVARICKLKIRLPSTTSQIFVLQTWLLVVVPSPNNKNNDRGQVEVITGPITIHLLCQGFDFKWF